MNPGIVFLTDESSQSSPGISEAGKACFNGETVVTHLDVKIASNNLRPNDEQCVDETGKRAQFHR